ncbi:MAG: GNAT family N-acetyltransferase [Clostridiales bacterium]|nr:GNAT family N-acetyltransferase [Clostridiales bacterium]
MNYSNTTIETSRLVLKMLDGSFADMVSHFLISNKDFFAPYESEKPPFYYSAMYQTSVLDHEYQSSINMQYLRYYVFLKEDLDTVIGTVSLGKISPFPYNDSILGYRFDKDFCHKGYATEAVAAILHEGFTTFKLHRVSSYVMENNIPSINLMSRLGFKYEGLCEKNINIRGQWESHRLYALLNPYEI